MKPLANDVASQQTAAMRHHGNLEGSSSRVDEDHLALAAAADTGAALCTIVGIEGSFSRRVGAQLAILPDGSVRGSLSDGCLEQQLASDCRALTAPELRGYGSGSPRIDFRLPCGGGLDILLDPAPDRAACASVLAALEARHPARLPLPGTGTARSYIPRLRIIALGEGPELEALGRLARAASIEIEAKSKDALTLGKASGHVRADPWTATVLLFHDHEWELALLDEALGGEAFYIGAQGGAKARAARVDELRRKGVAEEAIARIRSPIGVPTGSRTPQTLALSVLSEITHGYESLRPAF